MRRPPQTLLPVALLVTVALACEPPSDVLVEPVKYSPVAESDGRFRVTSGTEPAEPRGFTPDGRLVFRTRGLAPFGPNWVLVSAPTDSGYVREEAGIYRRALVDEVGALGQIDGRRVLAVWKPPLASPDSGWLQGCPDPAPRVPSPVAFTLYELPALDGLALSNIPIRNVDARIVAERTEPGPPGTFTNVRVRVTPSAREVSTRGGNPYGPALMPGRAEVIYSDGEAIWRASMADTSQLPELVAPGAYPTISADGTLLAYARPLGVDSTTETFIVAVNMGTCVQEHVEITASTWELVVRDLSSGDERGLGEGLEPTFDPLAARVLVRGAAELEWIDLATGARTSVTPTANAFAPFTSPDGSVFAFAVAGAGTPSVFFLRIPR